MNDCIPYYEPGARLQGTPSVAVIGKRFIRISGDRNADGTLTVAPCPANGRALGVAAWDAPIGGKVGILRGDDFILPVTAGAAIAADQEVMSDAQGRAIPAAAGGFRLGVCLTAVVNVGDDAMIALYPAPSGPVA
jgi:predicted RecA/RadA family phage recombinase